MCEDAKEREVAILVISVGDMMNQGSYQQEEGKVNYSIEDTGKQSR